MPHRPLGDRELLARVRRPQRLVRVPRRPEPLVVEVVGDDVDMRVAAYIVAINRVATVTKMRGMYA